MALLRPVASAASTPADPTDQTDPTTAGALRLPTGLAVGELLRDLLDRPVVVRDAPGGAPTAGRIGLFVDDRDRPAAYLVADRAFVVHAGTSLALMPAGGFDDAIATGDVPDAVAENFREVVNIMASLLNVDTTGHVRLSQVWTLDDPAAPTVDESGDARRHTFEVEVQGYGVGLVSLGTITP